MWQRILVYRIQNICGNYRASFTHFYGPFPTYEYVVKLRIPRFGDNKSESSGLLSSYAIPSYHVAGDNSRYKRPLNKADNSPPFSLWFRTVGALPPRPTVPSLTRLGIVTTLADISCTRTTYKASVFTYPIPPQNLKTW
jgi:hypothetical protein